MQEPPKTNRRLPELMAFFGAPPDAVEPVNRHLFARKLGEIIARAGGGKMREARKVKSTASRKGKP